MNRILLNENKAAADSVILYKKADFKNGQTVLARLAVMGLELNSVSDWETEVIPHFKTDFPNSTLDFNLDSKGIKKEFRDLETYYNGNKRGILFIEPTAGELEAIREQHRQYATEKQAEALALVHETVANLNRLKNEFQIPVSSMQSLSFCPVIASNADGLEVYDSNLLPYLLRLE
jgi:hypothetical protein